MSSFKDLRIVDNFYQTSAFFPMPTVLISTISDDGSTNLGPYSLVQPYYVAGKDYYAIINGVTAGNFPPVPVDYGYRDSKNFWYTRFPGLGNLRGAIPELLPVRATTIASVQYAVKRIDPDVQFTDDACAKLINIPRIFLPTALRGCVKWAKENGITLVTAEHMDIINDKRSKEKENK